MRDESKDSPALCPMKDLQDFKIADGDPDVRGWEVFTGEDRRIGEVHDLLIDTAAMRARYLDVHLDSELTGDSDHEPQSLADHLVHSSLLGVENELVGDRSVHSRSMSADRHVLIPIGRARLDREADRILVDSVRIEDVLDLTEYDHRTLDREQEASLLQRFDRGYVHSPERDFYSHSLFDDDSFYRHRRRPRAGIRPGETARREEEMLDSRRAR